MKGFQEYVSYINDKTEGRDLFCGKCGNVVQLNYKLKKDKKLQCPHCETINEYSPNENIREFGPKRVKCHPVAYWARKYGIPVNSCYMAIRKHKIRVSPKRSKYKYWLMATQREFLAGAVFTQKGQKIVSELLLSGNLLTEKEIKDSM